MSSSGPSQPSAGLSSLSTPSDPPTSTIAPAAFNPRSCVYCRSRKVKCDRQQPCSHCAKTSIPCVYPPGPGRAPKRSRRAVDDQLVDRLSKLESLIRRMQNNAGPDYEVSSGEVQKRAAPDHDGCGSEMTHTTVDSAIAGSTPSVTDSDSAASRRSIEQQFGRLLIDDKRSYYVSHFLWENLGNEIEELRDMLSDPSPEDEDYVLEHGASLGVNAAVLGFRSLAGSLRSCHPPLSQSVALLQVFTERILPVVRIFHMPTTTRVFWDTVSSVNTPDKNAEALVFSIYYSATIALESSECISMLGVSRDAALERFRFATEQALARANLLSTQSLVLLQAAVLFLTAFRNEDDSRAAWSLTALIFHIAQAMGLHRDGTVFRLKPLETELRRRMWFHICVLDNRMSEYNGHESIVWNGCFDTRPPLHINDADITAEMTSPPTERDEVCEMTFTRIRSVALHAGWKTNHSLPSFHGGHPSLNLSLEEREKLAEDFIHQLREPWLSYCTDMSDPYQFMCVNVANIITARIRFTLLYQPAPRQGGQPTTDNGKRYHDPETRDKLFQTSLEILETAAQMLTNDAVVKWRWHSKTNIQWHAVAFVLAEICARPPGPDCDRAWRDVGIVYERWRVLMQNDSAMSLRSTLWRPVARLIAKARYVREMQQQKRDLASANGTAVPDAGFPGLFGGSGAASVNMTSFPERRPQEGVADVSVEAGGSGFGMANTASETAFGTASFDPMMSMLPDDWQSDFLEVMQSEEVGAFGQGGLGAPMGGWLGAPMDLGSFIG